MGSELAGRLGLWNTVSLSIGGPSLDPVDVAVLDAVTTSSLAADPRIWPMKLTRLTSAYGDPITGMCAAMSALSRAPMGSRPVEATARFLVDLSARLERGHRLADELERIREEGRPIPGFGVPSRKSDERVVALRSCLVELKRDRGPYWTLVDQICAQISTSQRSLPVNLAAAMSATLLDVGFTAEQVLPVATMVLLPNFLANAYEGAQQAPAVLKRLPDHVVEYMGPGPRRSPRAEE